jgi:uncharacterized membrane protein
MKNEYSELIAAAAHLVELAGVLVLLAGAVCAALVFGLRLAQSRGFETAYHGLRADLARAILLGLELLVIGDIILTVAVEPTLQNVGVLAIIVAIRTFLSFSLELEVSGRWPWQRGAGAPTAGMGHVESNRRVEEVS